MNTKTAAEIVQHAIRTSRTEKRMVHLDSHDQTSASELFKLLFKASENSTDDRCYQIFWGGVGDEGWQISLYYPYL